MKKNIFFIFFFSFVLVLLATFVSASPIWIQDPPDRQLEYNDYFSMWVSSYVTGISHDSTTLTFRNPDTNNNVVLFGDTGGSHSNSYFSISLSTQGFIQFSSKNRTYHDLAINLGVGNNHQTQSGRTFYVDIDSDPIPIQIASFASPYNLSLYGSVVLDLNNFFSGYNAINVSYYDDTLGSYVNLIRSNGQGIATSTGSVRVTLQPYTSDQYLTIEALGIIYNRNFTITASNNFGSVKSNFTIVAQSISAVTDAHNYPFYFNGTTLSGWVSITNFIPKYDVTLKDVETFHGDSMQYAFVYAKNYTPGFEYTYNLLNYTNVVGYHATFNINLSAGRTYGVFVLNSTNDPASNQQKLWVYDPTNITAPQTSININFPRGSGVLDSATCSLWVTNPKASTQNNGGVGGCGTVNSLDNIKSISSSLIYVNTTQNGSSPFIVSQLEDISMNFDDSLLIPLNLEDYFGNYQTIYLQVGNYSTSITKGQGSNEVLNLTFASFRLYEPTLSVIMFDINSYDQVYTGEIELYATNQYGQVSNNFTLTISEYITSGGSTQTGVIAGIVNEFISIFPSSEDLTLRQRFMYVFVCMLLTAVVLLIVAGYSRLMQYILLIILFAEFFMFLAIDYIPISIIAVLLIIFLGISYLRRGI